MLHVWLIPAIMVLFIGMAAFYVVIKIQGGSGERTPGRTVVDEPVQDENPPPP
jgi:hypothetical protein